MKKNRLSLCLILVVLLTVRPGLLNAQILVNETFEGYVSGDVPVGSIPSTPTGIRFVQVVTGSANEAGGGTGNGLQLYDNDPAVVSYGTNFVADTLSNVAAVHASFNLAMGTLPKGAAENDTMVFGIGQFGANLSGSAGRLATLTLRDNSQLRVGGTLNSSYVSFADGVDIDIYINDYNTGSLTYTDPLGFSQTLAADSVALYLNGTLNATIGLNTSLLGGENGIGQFSFYSGTGTDNMNFTFDNLLIEVIPVPEPSTWMMLGTGLCVIAILHRKVS